MARFPISTILSLLFLAPTALSGTGRDDPPGGEGRGAARGHPVLPVLVSHHPGPSVRAVGERLQHLERILDHLGALTSGP